MTDEEITKALGAHLLTAKDLADVLVAGAKATRQILACRARAAHVARNAGRLPHVREPENVIKFPAVHLIAKLKDNLARETANRLEWIEVAIERAALLCEARARLPSDNAFGEWLERNEIHIKRHDREALLNLGLNSEAMRGILESTNRVSYQHIWRDFQQQISAGTKE
jgi:hypothetical protein